MSSTLVKKPKIKTTKIMEVAFRQGDRVSFGVVIDEARCPFTNKESYVVMVNGDLAPRFVHKELLAKFRTN